MKRRKAMLAVYAAVILFLGIVGLWVGQGRGGAESFESPSTGPTLTPQATALTPRLTKTPGPVSPEPTAEPLLSPGPFELPLEGATGYTTISMNLRRKPSSASERLKVLPPGTAFRIDGEEGAYWHVTGQGFSGYIAHRYCMINLPDILPSIVYDNTNSRGSLIRASGKRIPGITGEKLYENSAYNSRLGNREFIMPVLYDMAKKIGVAQKSALRDGNSLKIYEAYRPYGAQKKVVDALNALAARDADVLKGISTPPWKVSWFASQGTSHHQRGCAIDVSLVKVVGTKKRTSGSYAYSEVTEFSEYKMPTAMHELSIAAAAFQEPVRSSSKVAWKSARLAAGMNEAAKMLQRYCTDAGLTPLASEWWHFNDLDAYARVKDNAGQGESVLRTLHSVPPGT